MVDIEGIRIAFTSSDETLEEIASRFGVTKTTVRNYAKKFYWTRSDARSHAECSICGKRFMFSGGRKTNGRNYCGPKCRGKALRLGFTEINSDYGYAEGISSGTIGAMHELIVAADCLKNGLSAFRSVDPYCKVDFLILKGMSPFRLEVTTGSMYGDKIQHPTKELYRFDILAVVFRDWQIRYAAVINGALVWAESIDSAICQIQALKVAA